MKTFISKYLNEIMRRQLILNTVGDLSRYLIHEPLIFINSHDFSHRFQRFSSVFSVKSLFNSALIAQDCYSFQWINHHN